MAFLKKKYVVILLVLLLAALVYLFFAGGAPKLVAVANVCIANYQRAARKVYTKDYVYGAGPVVASADSSNSEPLPEKLANPPAILKAVYVTGWSAGSKNYLAYLDGLLKTTQINAVVVDVKDSTGVVSYKTNAPLAKQYKAYFPEIADINKLVNHLHTQGIYVIGRIAVFEDPALAKSRPDLAVYDKLKTTDLAHPVLWEDNNKLSWVDPASQEVYGYNIEIAKDALSHGFDEINFDYVRFPTDGSAGNMGFPKWDLKNPRNFVIKNFFKTLREGLPGAKLSVDLFGQTTTNTDDMGIGQIWEDALPYFDYVSPMVYPSHYIDGFLGYKNPADHPYEIIKYAIDSALARENVQAKINASTPVPLAKIRPWIQDFNLGAVYDANMVQQEIKAVSDSLGENFSGYLIWNPSNVYTKEAIAK